MVPAKFDERTDSNERFIVSGFGEYVVVWSLSDVVMNGKTKDYKFTKAEGQMILVRLIVDEGRVAMGERAPAGVLAAEAHRDALRQQGAHGEGLTQSPVHLAAGPHLVPGGELVAQLGMHAEPVGHGAQRRYATAYRPDDAD